MASHRPLRTPRLTILPADVARLETLLCNVQSFTLVTGLRVADDFCPFRGALESTLAQLRRAPAQERPWFAPRLLVLDPGAEVIGVVGFKGPPKDGRVELGYSVAPAHQNLGFATEAVRALTDHAFGFPGVHTIMAQTLPQPSASIRVLEKCGFQRVNEILDSLEGLVWIWERSAKAK